MQLFFLKLLLYKQDLPIFKNKNINFFCNVFEKNTFLYKYFLNNLFEKKILLQ